MPDVEASVAEIDRLRFLDWLNASSNDDVQAPGVDLSGLDLRNLRMSHANLRGANLSGADLSGTNLEFARLMGVSLTGAKYNARTKWPTGFDPVKAGAVTVD